MDNTFILALLANSERLIALSAISQVINLLNKKHPKLESIVRGLVFGVMGIFIMMYPFTLESGISFDSRSILLSLTALFYSYPTTIVVTVMLMAYRIYMGGAGMNMGLMVILTSSLLGYIWKTNSYLKQYHGRWIYYYSLGVVVHFMMCVYIILLPSDVFYVTFTKIGIPILISYPLVTIIIGKLFNMQIIKKDQDRQIIKGENTIRRIYDNAPIGILTISNTDHILGANSEFCDLVGQSEVDLLGKRFLDFIISNSEDEDITIIDQITTKKIDSYSGDRIMVKKNGLRIWINLSVSRIDEANEFIITIQDISRRKESELLNDYLAYHDLLTGAYNIKFLTERIIDWEKTLIFPKYFICVDVDNLRIVNDAYGFKTGDELLKSVYQAVYQSTNSIGKLIRFKSSEFILYVFDVDKVTISRIITDIRNSVDKIDLENIEVSVSIGISEIKADTNKVTDSILLAEENMRKEKLLSLDRSVNNMIDVILKSLFAKNSREMLHSQRVSSISQNIAIKMKLDKYSIEKTRIAGLMHDIGKIGIPESILDKPEALNEEEMLKIQEHSIIGYRILSATNEFVEISDIILSHHERWDGKGYPRGLSQDSIPLFARIIAVADTYDAMTSERPYRNVYSSEEAMIMIKEKAGSQLDPYVVKIFVSLIENSNPSLNLI